MSSSSLSRVGVSLIRGIRGLSSRNLCRFTVSVPVSVSSLSSSSPSLSSLSFPSSNRSFSSGLLQPGTGRLKQTKRDLLTFLDDECRDLTRPDDEEMKAYMDEQGLVATFDAKNNQIALKRSVENVTASIRFLVEPDGEDDMNQENPEHQPEGGEEGENENQQQEGEEGQDPNEEQPPKPAVHSFIVDLNINGANGAPNSFLRVYAHADQNGQLIVDNLNNSQTACQKADEAKGIEDMEPSMELSSLQLEDLPEEAAEKVFELLNDLGVDDRLALFIQQYTFELRTKQHVEKINALKAFIDQIGN